MTTRNFRRCSMCGYDFATNWGNFNRHQKACRRDQMQRRKKAEAEWRRKYLESR